MGKNKKKSNKNKTNTKKEQSESQSSQESKPVSSAQIDIEPCDTSEVIEATEGSQSPNTTILSEGSDSIGDTKGGEISKTKLTEESDFTREDTSESDMKRQSSNFSGTPDSPGSSKRRSGRDHPSSGYRNDGESHYGSKFSGTSDSTGFSKRTSWRDNPSSRFRNDRESNNERGTFKPPNERRSEQYKRPNQNEDFAKQTKRTSCPENSNRPSHYSNGPRTRNARDEDDEFQRYKSELAYHRGRVEFVKTKEIVGDLFKVPEDYALAHCVAEDMNMGSGIAVQFRYRFKRVDALLNQHQRTGGLAVLEVEKRYIYYLVTKRFSTGKPTLSTLFSSLKRLREHVMENGVDKIAMPRIGCGLDRLEWEDVKFMIEFVFRDVDVDILVCNLEPTGDSSPQRHRNCRLTNETYPIQDIAERTVILYFSTEDEAVSDEMKKLDEKFHFLTNFKYAKKSVGSVVFYDKHPGYLLCGCIVRKSERDAFNFIALQKCVYEIQKENKKNNFYYYAFQAMKDADSNLNYKIINILRNSLRGAEVYVCWPEDLQDEMAQRDRFSDSRATKSYTRNLSPQEANTRRQQSEKQQDSSDQEQAPGYTPPLQAQHNKANDTFEIDNWDVPEPSSNQKEETTPLEDMSFSEEVNHEYESFQLDLEKGNIDCRSLKEQHPSTLPRQYSRVCFVSENLMINDGIPPGPDIDDLVGRLFNQNEKAGGVVYSKEGSNFLYCLIISGATTPPTSYTVFSAIQKLRDHAVKNGIRNLVIPKMTISAECDYKWEDVTTMFQFLLGRKVDMVVAQFSTAYNSASLAKKNHNKITHVKSPLHQMKKKSVIIYLTSVDGFVTDEMKSLEGKFDFLQEFKKKKKSLGDVIRYKQNEDHVLYGCVVKRKHSDRVDFEELQKCLKEVNKLNTEKLSFVGIQAIDDQVDNLNYKIATIMLTCLHNVNVMMCWPGELRRLMPGYKA